MSLPLEFIRCHHRFTLEACLTCARRIELAPCGVDLTVTDASSANAVVYQLVFPCEHYLAERESDDYTDLQPQKLEHLAAGR